MSTTAMTTPATHSSGLSYTVVEFELDPPDDGTVTLAGIAEIVLPFNVPFA